MTRPAIRPAAEFMPSRARSDAVRECALQPRSAVAGHAVLDDDQAMSCEKPAVEAMAHGDPSVRAREEEALVKACVSGCGGACTGGRCRDDADRDPDRGWHLPCPR